MAQRGEATPFSAALDYQVSADRFTGSASIGLTLDLPLARNGFGPALSLAYGSARHQGAFGRGWALSGLPVIGVDSDDKLPAYDGRDGYSSSLAGSLVRVRNPDGTPATRDEGGFLVETFRAREDTARMRFDRWTERATGQVHWRSRDTANALTIYGRSAATRIADPDAPGRIYQWLPEITVDDRGDALVYDFLPEDTRGGAGARLADAGRPVGAQRYLKSLRWANAVPVGDAAAADADLIDWAFTAVLDYGDHDPDTPALAPDRDWSARPDPTSTGTAGFELRSWRLCQRLLVFHRFADLGPNPVLTRATTLSYELRADGSRLTSVARTGYRGTGAGRQSQSMPPLSFSYTEPALAEVFAPVTAALQATAPDGASASGTVLVDLYGEGLPGILHEDRAGWFFQRNLGGGRFAAPSCVQSRPAHSLAVVSVGDFDGDGNMDAVVTGGQGAGHYRFDRAVGAWSGFCAFRSIPATGGPGRHEQLDLTGDGRADLVARTEDGLRIHEALGADGFAPDPIRVRLAETAAVGPSGAPPLATDTATDFLFADMTGDGLSDQVLIRDGAVVYWPNLGRGRFGPPVTMENAPRFGVAGRFALDRVLLADLDGSGTSDLIEIGDGRIRIWTNESGNGFDGGRTLDGLPMIDTGSLLSIRDVTGDGRMALVWAERRAGRIASFQSLALAGATPPGLIETIENGLGRRDFIVYGHSAMHYLRDAGTARAWDTTLPRHMVVVDRIETADLIGGTTTETSLSYRNGAFDSRLRQFAGFGEVDMVDATFVEDEASALPAVEPVLTRAFFDQGMDTRLPGRAWDGDAAAVEVPAFTLDASLLVTAIDPDTALDTRAAVRGRIIRTEAYRVTDDGPDPVPMAVQQTGYAVRVEQAPGAAVASRRHRLDRAVFAVFERETVQAHHEGVADDPRVSHGFVLEHDVHGAATLVASLSYPRRPGPVRDDPAQDRLGCQIKRLEVAHDTGDDAWALNRPTAQEEFFVLGLVAPPRGWFEFGEIAAVVAGALAAPLDHDNPPVAGRATRSNRSRRIYCAADGTPAALGDAALPARLHHTETACFTGSFATSRYGAGILARLAALGYTEADGHWWKASETLLYHTAASFFLPAGTRLSDGSTVSVDYDAAALFPVQVTDPFGGAVATLYDYAALSPRRTDSPTGAWTETLFDPLARPVRASHGGTVADTLGASQTWGFDPVSTAAAPSVATALADPEAA